MRPHFLIDSAQGRATQQIQWTSGFSDVEVTKRPVNHHRRRRSPMAISRSQGGLSKESLEETTEKPKMWALPRWLLEEVSALGWLTCGAVRSDEGGAAGARCTGTVNKCLIPKSERCHAIQGPYQAGNGVPALQPNNLTAADRPEERPEER